MKKVYQSPATTGTAPLSPSSHAEERSRSKVALLKWLHQRGVGIGRLPKAALLSALLTAQPGFTSEFSVRLHRTAPSGIGASVSLFGTCTSWECGQIFLSSDPRPEPELVLSFGFSAKETGVVRSAAPEPRDAWWVVVAPGDGIPLAMLWRPPAAGGHLPPTPFVEGASCRVAVTDDGGVIAGALVAPVVKEWPTELKEPRADHPAVFSRWRPWLPPRRTDSDGRAVFDVPAGGGVDLHVSAAGYRSAATSCRAGAVAAVPP